MGSRILCKLIHDHEELKEKWRNREKSYRQGKEEVHLKVVIMSKSLYEIKYLPSERTWSTTTSRNKIPENHKVSCFGPIGINHNPERWNLTMGSSSAALMLKTEPPTAAKLPFTPFFLNLQTPKWKSLKWGIGNIELCRVGSDTVYMTHQL